MTEPSESELTKRERQIMHIVYRLGEATAVDVLGELQQLPDPPNSKSGVRALLKILEDKRLLVHRQAGQTYYYRPSQPRGTAGRSAFQRVLQTFFDGSLEKAVAAHLSDGTVDLTDEELHRLVELIRQAREKGE